MKLVTCVACRRWMGWGHGGDEIKNLLLVWIFLLCPQPLIGSDSGGPHSTPTCLGMSQGLFTSNQMAGEGIRIGGTVGEAAGGRSTPVGLAWTGFRVHISDCHSFPYCSGPAFEVEESGCGSVPAVLSERIDTCSSK